MVVYIEYAFLENFMIDGALLFIALKCARERAKWYRLLFAALLGAAEAIVFPLLPLPVWAGYLVKFFFGLLLPIVAVSGKKFTPYLVTAAAFLFFTFALGGLLTAVYSFFKVSYREGEGYLIGRAPAGLVLGGTLVFCIAAVLLFKRFYRFGRLRRNLLPCTLTAGGRDVHWQGFVDSGNLLTFRGKPVCVVSPAAIFALFGRGAKEEGRMTVTTVNGTKNSPVFACEKMCITAGKKSLLREDVYLTVGDVGSKYQLILSSALMEA